MLETHLTTETNSMEDPFGGTERRTQWVLPISLFSLAMSNFYFCALKFQPLRVLAMSIPIPIKAIQYVKQVFTTLCLKLWSVLSLSFSSRACHQGRVRDTPGAPTMNLPLENRTKVRLTSDIIHYIQPTCGLFFSTTDFLIAKG